MAVQVLEFVSHVVVADLAFKIVERFGPGHVTHGSPFRVTGNTVVSAPLYVHRGQVQRHGVSRREQMID